MFNAGLKLGTSYDKKKVYEAAIACGFEGKEQDICFRHGKHRYLRIQVHEPSFFYDTPSVVTEMEFDNFSGVFDEPNAVFVLRSLYEHLPGMLCRAGYCLKGKETPVSALSELLASFD